MPEVKALSTRRGLFLALLAVGAVMVGLAAVAGLGMVADADIPLSVLLVLVACGLAALWATHTLIDDHFAELDRLRGDLGVAAAANTALSPRWSAAGGAGPELKRLAETASTLLNRRVRPDAAIDARLSAVLAAVGEGIVVVTDSGLVSLVNGAARDRLGAAAVAVGTSVYAALDRPSLTAAMAEARRSQRPVSVALVTADGEDLPATVVDLGAHGGAVLCFAAAAGAQRQVEHDLGLHDRAPPPGPIGPNTPLRELPMLVLDTETTGVDVRRDRIVSIAALPLHGARLYKAEAFDRLVNPGIAIPPAAIAIHGITDAMVGDAPSFADVARELRAVLEGRVLVGHNVGFDAAMLRRAAALAGVAWPEAPTLCLARLEAMLEPDGADLSLDAMARRRGIDVHGRHTALGDVLVTAELLVAMLPRLAERGVATFGQATEFALRATALVEKQRAAGWLADAAAP